MVSGIYWGSRNVSPTNKGGLLQLNIYCSKLKQTKKEEYLRSRKQWVQSRKAMKGSPRMAAKGQPVHVFSIKGSWEVGRSDSMQ